jgi:hypothetical protein
MVAAMVAGMAGTAADMVAGMAAATVTVTAGTSTAVTGGAATALARAGSGRRWDGFGSARKRDREQVVPAPVILAEETASLFYAQKS